jgi:hypothetical protein
LSHLNARLLQLSNKQKLRVTLPELKNSKRLLRVMLRVTLPGLKNSKRLLHRIWLERRRRRQMHVYIVGSEIQLDPVTKVHTDSIDSVNLFYYYTSLFKARIQYVRKFSC